MAANKRKWLSTSHPRLIKWLTILGSFCLLPFIPIILISVGEYNVRNILSGTLICMPVLSIMWLINLVFLPSLKKVWKSTGVYYNDNGITIMTIDKNKFYPYADISDIYRVKKYFYSIELKDGSEEYFFGSITGMAMNNPFLPLNPKVAYIKKEYLG